MEKNGTTGGDRLPVKKRKKPLKQRIAIAIVRAVEGREQKKAGGRPAPQRAADTRAAASSPQGAAGQRPRMTPQQKREQIRRMRRRRTIGRVLLACVVLLVVILILSRTVLFKIKTIDVTNPEDANYTVEQIVAQCGAYTTENLFRCDLDKIERNIEQNLPYIGHATVERDFPSSLRVTVEPTKAAAAMAFGTGYLLIDADGKMLENTDTAPDDVPVLRCNTEFEMNLGQFIGVSVSGKKPDDKTRAAAEMLQLFKKIYVTLQETGVQDITLIDIRDTRAITLMYQNRLTLHLGSEDLLETKLHTAAKTIAAEDDGSRTRTGAIDLTTVPYAFARDTYEQATDVSSPEEESTEIDRGT